MEFSKLASTGDGEDGFSRLHESSTPVPLTAQQRRQRVLAFKTATLEAARAVRSALRQRLNDVERFKFKSNHYVNVDGEVVPSALADTVIPSRSENDGKRHMINPVPPNFAKYSQVAHTDASNHANPTSQVSAALPKVQQLQNASHSLGVGYAGSTQVAVSSTSMSVNLPSSDSHMRLTDVSSKAPSSFNSLEHVDGRNSVQSLYEGRVCSTNLPPNQSITEKTTSTQQNITVKHPSSLHSMGMSGDSVSLNEDTDGSKSRSQPFSKSVRGKKTQQTESHGKEGIRDSQETAYDHVPSNAGIQRSVSYSAILGQDSHNMNCLMPSSSQVLTGHSSTGGNTVNASGSSLGIIKPKPAKRRASDSRVVSHGLSAAPNVPTGSDSQMSTQSYVAMPGTAFAGVSQHNSRVAFNGDFSNETQMIAVHHLHDHPQVQQRIRNDSDGAWINSSELHKGSYVADSIIAAGTARQKSMLLQSFMNNTSVAEMFNVTKTSQQRQIQTPSEIGLFAVGNDGETDDEKRDANESTNALGRTKEMHSMLSICDHRNSIIGRLTAIETAKYFSRSAPASILNAAIRKVPSSKCKIDPKVNAIAASAGMAVTASDISYGSHENTDAESFSDVPPLCESIHFSDRIHLKSKGHWDYLLEEVQWMAVDFKQEMRWKLATAKATGQACCLRAVSCEKSRLESWKFSSIDCVMKESVRRAIECSTPIVGNSEGCEEIVFINTDTDHNALLCDDVHHTASTTKEVGAVQIEGRIVKAHADDKNVEMVLDTGDAINSTIDIKDADLKSKGFESCRRSVAHVISKAVKKMWLSVQLAILPVPEKEMEEEIEKWMSEQPLDLLERFYQGEIMSSTTVEIPSSFIRALTNQINQNLEKENASSEIDSFNISHVQEILKNLLTFKPDSASVSPEEHLGVESKTGTDLLEHQELPFRNACTLNSAQYGAFLYGPQFSGKTTLSIELLKRWTKAQHNNQCFSNGIVPMIFVFTPRQREAKWFVYLENVVKEAHISEAANMQSSTTIIPIIWSSVESSAELFVGNLGGNSSSIKVLIVAFEDCGRFFSHAQAIKKEERSELLQGSLLRNACGVIVDCSFSDLLGRESSISFPEVDDEVGCKGRTILHRSSKVDNDFESFRNVNYASDRVNSTVPTRLMVPAVVKAANLTMELLAEHSPPAMCNRCLMSAHSFFSDCFDFYSVLAFLIPGSRRWTWQRYFGRTDERLDESADIPTSIKIPMSKSSSCNPDDSANDGEPVTAYSSKEICSFGSIQIGQENRNILSQIATNLSVAVEFPHEGNIMINEELIVEAMPSSQSKKYFALENAFLGDAAACSGESPRNLAQILTAFRSVCLHPSLISVRYASHGHQQLEVVSSSNEINTNRDGRTSQPFLVPPDGCLISALNPFNRVLQNAMKPSGTFFPTMNPESAENDSVTEDHVTIAGDSCKLRALMRLLRKHKTERVVVTVESLFEMLLVHKYLNSENVSHILAGNTVQFEDAQGDFISRRRGIEEEKYVHDEDILHTSLLDIQHWLMAQKAVKLFNDSAESRILVARMEVFCSLSLNPIAADAVIMLSECWVFRKSASRRAMKNCFLLPMLVERKRSSCMDNTNSDPQQTVDTECSRRQPVCIYEVVAAGTLEEKLTRSGKTFLHFQGSSTSDLASNTRRYVEHLPVNKNGPVLSSTALISSDAIYQTFSSAPAFTPNIAVQGSLDKQISKDKFQRRYMFDRVPLFINNEPIDELNESIKTSTFPSSPNSSSSNMKTGRGKGMIALSADGHTTFVRPDDVEKDGISSEDHAAQDTQILQGGDRRNTSRTRANILTVLMQLRNFDVLSDEAFMGTSLDPHGKRWLRIFSRELNYFEKSFFTKVTASSVASMNSDVHQHGVIQLGCFTCAPPSSIMHKRHLNSTIRIGGRRRSSDPVIRIFPASASVDKDTISNEIDTFTEVNKECGVEENISSFKNSNVELISGREFVGASQQHDDNSRNINDNVCAAASWKMKSILEIWRLLYEHALRRYYQNKLRMNFTSKLAQVDIMTKKAVALWLCTLDDVMCERHFFQHPSFSEHESMRMRMYGLGEAAVETNVRTRYFDRVPVDGTGMFGASLADSIDQPLFNHVGAETIFSNSSTISKQSLAELERSRLATTGFNVGVQNAVQSAISDTDSWTTCNRRFHEVSSGLSCCGIPFDNTLYVNPLNTAHIANIHLDSNPPVHGSSGFTSKTGCDTIQGIVKMVIPRVSTSRSNAAKRGKMNDVVTSANSRQQGVGSRVKGGSKNLSVDAQSTAVDSQWHQDRFEFDPGAPLAQEVTHHKVGTVKKRSANSGGINSKPKIAKRQKITQNIHRDGQINSGNNLDGVGNNSQRGGIVANDTTSSVPASSVPAMSVPGSIGANTSSIRNMNSDSQTSTEDVNAGFIEWRPAEDDIIICMQNSIYDPDFTHTENWLNQPRQQANISSASTTVHRKRTAEEARRRYDELCQSGQKDTRLKDRNIQNIIQKLKSSTKK